MKKQKICLFLATALVLLSLTACGVTNDPGSENQTDALTGDGVQTADGTSNGPESIPETVPDTESEEAVLQARLDELRELVNWGGKNFGILYINDINGYTEEVEAEEKANNTSSSAVVNDAVYNRNILFEEYCKLHFALVPAGQSAVPGILQNEVSSGTGDFHLVSQTTAATASAATTGSLYDFLELESIDYEQAWWDRGTLDFALGGHVFFMNGPFNIVDDDVTFVMIFNKQLREDYKIANPYDTVKNNEWTLDYFNSVIAALSSDNGDGKWDENDTYGFSTPGSIGNTFFYGAGLQYINNNRDMDEPELMLTEAKMEQALNTLAVARSIVHDNNSTYVAAIGSEGLSLEVFRQGRSLFYCEAANYLRTLNTSMETDYGILPIPKYSSEQEYYTTWSHSIGSTLSIPTTVAKGDIEQFAHVLEMYTLLSQQYVRPAYYDSLLTIRNVRDPESSEMVELIFEHRIYDMAMYFTDFGFNAIFETSVRDADTFSSSYSKFSGVFDRRLERLLEKIN